MRTMAIVCAGDAGMRSEPRRRLPPINFANDCRPVRQSHTPRVTPWRSGCPRESAVCRRDLRGRTTLSLPHCPQRALVPTIPQAGSPDTMSHRHLGGHVLRLAARNHIVARYVSWSVAPAAPQGAAKDSCVLATRKYSCVLATSTCQTPCGRAPRIASSKLLPNKLTVTAYKKNDQAFVEEINGAVVRRLVARVASKAWRQHGRLDVSMQPRVFTSTSSSPLSSSRRSGGRALKSLSAITHRQCPISERIPSSIRRSSASSRAAFQSGFGLCCWRRCARRKRNWVGALTGGPDQRSSCQQKHNLLQDSLAGSARTETPPSGGPSIDALSAAQAFSTPTVDA
jgi:hypothetical protein